MRTDFLYDLITGKCIREIKFEGAPPNALFLTFDDGPDPDCTPKILEILKRHEAKATFFVIGKKAQAESELIHEILSQGHSIGDHTIDHATSHYFKDEDIISEWLKNSSHLLTNELKLNPVAFRSPLGIKTPALNKVLRKNKTPLVLWNIRFFDSIKGFSVKDVNQKLASIKNGSIILLHDTHIGDAQKSSLMALEHLIIECKKRNFEFLPLSQQLVQNSFLEKYEIKK